MMRRETIVSLVFGLVLLAPTLAMADIAAGEFEKAMSKYMETDAGKKALGATVENYFRQRQEEMRKQREKDQEQELEDQFKKPVSVDIGSSPTRGPKDAPITIVEFSDFQCPYCSRANQVIDQVLKEYDGKVRIAFKNLPLPFHQQAEPAAKAALAASKQGKFWEMHDALFENQRQLSEEFYLAQAKELGLDIEKFKKDMESEDVKKQIAADTEAARQHGISGTPGFFVNGVAVKGALPFSHFKSIIDRWLEKKA
ncbi:MAG: thioredoxin domain-containing protein [Bdellovibrionales bacterium]|nr:thioredoxin domain-containing protein [Bdellovibrionales bacterium]